MVRNAAGTEDENNRLRQQLAFRRRQLFHEIAEIFPIVQVNLPTSCTYLFVSTTKTKYLFFNDFI